MGADADMTLAFATSTLAHPIELAITVGSVFIFIVAMNHLRTRNHLKSDIANLKSLKVDIDVALRALSEARAALGMISKNDITELKALNNPPAAVKDVLDTVCITMEVAEPSWKAAQKLMGDTKFLSTLASYDADHRISPSIRMALADFVSRPDMSPDVVKKKSCAAAGLCRWLDALHSYDHARAALVSKRAALFAATPWWQRCFIPSSIVKGASKVAPVHAKKDKKTPSAAMKDMKPSSNRLALAKPPLGGNEAPFPLTKSVIHDERFGVDVPPVDTAKPSLFCLPSALYSSVDKRDDKEWLVIEPTVEMGTTRATDLRAHLPESYGTGGGLDTALPPSGVVWAVAEAGVVSADMPTAGQLKVLAARAHKYAEGALPETVRSKKIARLAKRMAAREGEPRGSGPASPPEAFFEVGLRIQRGSFA